MQHEITPEAAALITQARALGLGSNEMARILDINPTTMAHWFNLRRVPPPGLLSVLRAILEFRSRSTGRSTAGTGTD